MLTVLLRMLVHETEKGSHGVLVHRVDPFLAVRSIPHELTELEALQVVGDRRLFHVALFGKLRHCRGLLEEKQHEFHSLGIAERFQELPMGGR